MDVQGSNPQHPQHSHDGEPSDTFQDMLQALAQPSALPAEPHTNLARISIVQTHASAVLLTATRAYKLKKPVNLGFLDYSTPRLRRARCLDECRVNQALAPAVYLGVAPVLKHGDGRFSIGAVSSPGHAPKPGARLGEGIVDDFAVVMRRLPDSRTLATLVAANRANADLLAHIARLMARFHAAAGLPPTVDLPGLIDDTLANVYQTLAQARADIGGVASAESHAAISAYIGQFSQRRRALLDARAQEGWARDCHGDLRLEHVYINPSDDEMSGQAPTIIIVDRIEFDPRYRRGDVAGEIAFLAIELEAAGRSDLARAFTQAYTTASGDTSMLEVMPFYKVYRALVRGHVRALYAAQPGADDAARALARAEASRMYALAAHHSATPVEPVIALVGGLIGSGKSTLAQALAAETGWRVISSDMTRKTLAGLEPIAPSPPSALRSLYTPTWDDHVYERMSELTAALLAQGRSVLLDATFASRTRRQSIARLASESRARAMFIECVCPPAEALARLDARWRMKLAGSGDNSEIFASDGRPALYQRLARRWEAFDATADTNLSHVIVDTTWTLPRQVERALDALSIPRLACPLT